MDASDKSMQENMPAMDKKETIMAIVSMFKNLQPDDVADILILLNNKFADTMKEGDEAPEKEKPEGETDKPSPQEKPAAKAPGGSYDIGGVF